MTTHNYKISDLLGQSYIACVDLEATCDDDPNFNRRDMEIIEFGLTLLNPEYKVVGTMNTFVRPTINPILSKFCKELTSITQEQVDNAPTWDDAAYHIGQFFDQMIPEGAIEIWVSWGDFDRNLIARECARYNVTDPMAEAHFNLKKLEASHRNTKKQEGLMKTINRLGLKFPGTLHRASDDAEAVSMLMRELGPGLVRSKL